MRGDKPATWIAVDVALPFDPRVRALGRAVGTELADGWVVRVMGWLKQHARDGQVGGYSADIADAIRWPYAVDLAQAFSDAGLLDARGVLLGWTELNGWLVARAEKDRKRHRKDSAPMKDLDRHGLGGRADGGPDGRSVGRAEVPGSFHGASAEDRSRRKKR
jgi:hypothetical protein